MDLVEPAIGGEIGMSMTRAPDPDELAADMARLEAALERIDFLAAPAPRMAGDPISPVVVDRLDSMIARLRAAIDEA